MVKKDPFLFYGEKKRRSRGFTIFFFGILAFIAVWVPFFGMNLQYQIGSIFYVIFTKLGEVCILAGWVILGFLILLIFVTRKIYFKAMIFSIVLLWAGYFLTGQVFVLFGFQLGINQPPGYH
ncbi:MAG: hypothetical protein ACFE8E_02905 [Candidatus Hodarchaeota archaeon]